ncbi:MAG: hypothetical protein WCH40_02200 [Verrucomicrobiales bacterium]
MRISYKLRNAILLAVGVSYLGLHAPNIIAKPATTLKSPSKSKTTSKTSSKSKTDKAPTAA